MNNSPVNPLITSSDAVIGTFINDMPVQVVAQLGEVTIYQTCAFIDSAVDNQNDDRERHHRVKMMQEERTSYGELNLGLHVQDNAEHVLTNRMRLLSAINKHLTLQSQALLSPTIKSLHWVNQVHGKQIHDIDASLLAMRPLDADALTSRQSGIGLAIMTADCVPIVLSQPATGQIAAIHAGWQGLACGVIKATATRFDNQSPIKAWIGVCISQAHYEVGSEVANKLLAGCTDNQLLSNAELHNFASLFCLKAETDAGNNSDNNNDGNSDNKLKLDLPKIAKAQLQNLSITVLNQSAIDCSYADSRYYSYRRQTHLRQPATGRMALIIARQEAIKTNA